MLRSVSSISVLFWVSMHIELNPELASNSPCDHCFTRVRWTWGRIFHRRISLFCKKVTFLYHGLKYFCLS
jgi:hypothetical protein